MLARIFSCNIVIAVLLINKDSASITCRKSEILCKLENRCVSRNYACDGVHHCFAGEDESYEHAGCDTCKLPPIIPNQKSLRVIRRNENNLLVVAGLPYKGDDRVLYTCKEGWEFSGSAMKTCKNGTWVGAVKCQEPCEPGQSGFSFCGKKCNSDNDCHGNLLCRCDGPCGRSCVDENVNCGDAPNSANSEVSYFGAGRNKTAHYMCSGGTFGVRGDTVLKCVGSGKWFGSALQCDEIYCGNPFESIYRTGGFITPYRPFSRYRVNETVEFRCSEGHRLLGPKSRTCLANGQWSGVLAVCDKILTFGSIESCPHPGIPINGKLSGGNFSISSKVTFGCDDEYFMIGERHQECTSFLQWSGGGAPICQSLRLSYIPETFLSKLEAPTTNVGRSNLNSNAGQQIYFILHVAKFDNSMRLKTKFIRALTGTITSSNNFGLILYASTSQKFLNSSSQLIDDFLSQADNGGLGLLLGEGNNLYKVVEDLITNDISNDPNIPKHIFILLDETQKIDEKKLNVHHGVNALEIYKIFFKSEDPKKKSFIEAGIDNLASKNFAYIQDNQQLQAYVHGLVVGKSEECIHCGITSDIGIVLKLHRVVNGATPGLGAWPWHASICNYDENVSKMYSEDNFLGGGSLINRNWVLTAAHLFNKRAQTVPDIAVSLGMTNRPRRQLDAYTQVYKIGKLAIHELYNDFDFDFALVKLGSRLTHNKTHFTGIIDEIGHNLVFNAFIRPICLPCSPTSCVRKFLQKPNKFGVTAITEGMTESEMCRAEVNYLLANKKGPVVSVGHGHNTTRPHGAVVTKLADTIQQVTLRLLGDTSCSNGLDLINGLIDKNYRFTDAKLCAGNYKPGEYADTCKGDSGGALMREVFNAADKQSRWVQIGVVSFGYGCGLTYVDEQGVERMYPGFYANVSNQIEWIRTIAFLNDCDELPEFENGKILYPLGRKKNQWAKYECNMGYRIEGSDVRTCNEDGFWNGKPPLCKLIECPLITDIENGYIVRIKGNSYGSAIEYFCNTNFTISGGSQKRLCQMDQTWSGSHPKCVSNAKPIKLTCDKLPKPTNGFLTFTDEQNIGSIATYTCNKTFILSEKFNQRICGLDAKWSGSTLECNAPDVDENPTECTEPATVANAVTQTFKPKYSFGESVTFECKQGFVMKGRSKIYCIGNLWTEKPQCDEVTCGTPNFVVGAVRQHTLQSYPVQKILFYKCNPGLKSTKPFIYCQKNGMWSDFKCVQTGCPDLPPISNGFIVYPNGKGHRDKAVYQCLDGFKLVSPLSDTVCQENGKWTLNNVTCQRIKCPLLAQPPHGRITYPNGRLFGGRAIYSCDQGYYTKGLFEQRICQRDEIWSGSAPVCMKSECPDLPPIANGEVYYLEGGNDEAIYVCNTGYAKIGGTDVRVCQKDLTWNGTPPICRLAQQSPASVVCPFLPSIKYGNIDYPEGRIVGKNAIHTCSVGYYLTGFTKRTCQSNREWSGFAPSCVNSISEVTPLPENTPSGLQGCSDPPMVMNGAINVYDGQEAVYICDPGYSADRDIRRLCQHDLTWSGAAPVCMPTPTSGSEFFNGINFDFFSSGRQSSGQTTPHQTSCCECLLAYEQVLECYMRSFW